MTTDHDDSLAAFADTLRRDFPPAAVSPRLSAAVGQALAPAREAEARLSWRGWLALAAAPACAALAVLFTPGFALPWQAPRRPVATTAAAAAISPTDFARDNIGSVQATRLAPAESARGGGAPDPAVYLRVRRDYVDTLRWRDRRTGAQLEISYPRAEVVTASLQPL